jgi:hypothetical protein
MGKEPPGPYGGLMKVVPLRQPLPATRDDLAALVMAYAESGDLEDAAKSCGLSLSKAVAVLRTMGARQMMARALRHVLDVETAPEALAVLRRGLRDPSARIRITSAATLLDRAGVVAQPADAARERNLSELSADDLAALIAELQAENAERAAAPQPAKRQPFDFMD